MGTIAKASFERRHLNAAINMFRRYPYPADVFNRYFFMRGTYPAAIPVNTPAGRILLNVYSQHDILTINEIFCRLDYRADDSDEIVVDFGSNIGISAAYFLTTSPASHTYLFEPLISNVERLHKNLAPYQGRYTLTEAAVGTTNGQVEFGWEESGRYGGVGMATGNYISVRCIDSNEILQTIVEKHGRIDILKIDIETLEEAVTTRIPVETARKIKKVYVEFPFSSNPLERTHSHIQYGSVAQFTCKSFVP
ncbi:MAG TPA: FkbM family methyltransferase [Acidobacteriaceae bacterium]|nr:FkbM family methyltransferase [Acidobacteriaceae bacterium]